MYVMHVSKGRVTNFLMPVLLGSLHFLLSLFSLTFGGLRAPRQEVLATM